jgi:hypothetical protein
MDTNVKPMISSFDEKIKEISNIAANEKVTNEKLSKLLERTENLIGEIQACK